jgi:hypothetical protein
MILGAKFKGASAVRQREMAWRCSNWKSENKEKKRRYLHTMNTNEDASHDGFNSNSKINFDYYV